MLLRDLIADMVTNRCGARYMLFMQGVKPSSRREYAIVQPIRVVRGIRVVAIRDM